jgi:hypothetical protein
MKLKKGGIAYTTQYGAGIFEVYDIVGDKIYTQPGGWVYKGNGERLALESDFIYKSHKLYEKFQEQNKNQEPNYEIY